MIYGFAGYEVDTDRLELRHDGSPVRIEPQVFDVLCFLLEHRDRVVTKIELFDAVWGGAFVGESALSSRIKSVRQLLGDSGKAQQVVRTVHGRGYQFVADVLVRDLTPGDGVELGGRNDDGDTNSVGAPTGTVTFLFSDIEGSSALWERHQSAMPDVIGRHDDILRTAISTNGGVVFFSAGDGMAAAFELASGAVAAARLIQSTLDAERWPIPDPIRVRLGLHAGEAIMRDGDYLGPTVNRAARVMAMAHGGQTLVSDVTARLLDDDSGLIDRGVCEIDVSMPTVRLWQLDGGSFPPLAGSVSSALPPIRTTMIGRDSDLEQVVDATTDSRIVSIVGPGGAGKTTLALAAADATVASFPAGVVFVELASARDASEAVQRIAQTARVDGVAGFDIALLAEHLARRPMLLVLDNCEHLLDECADVVDRVVDAGAEARILTTSREPLGVDGELVVPLGSLEENAADLFVARARAAAPGGDFSAGDQRIVDLCSRLDGLPLAIELAAAQMRHLGLDELVERLGHSLDLSRGGRSRGRDRHATLDHTIAWSYDLLDSAGQSVFRQLGVFPGSFDIRAAEAVAGTEPATSIAILADLVSKNLLVRDATTGRLRYLETIRAYAARRLGETDEAETAAERLRCHVVERATSSPRAERWISGARASEVRVDLDNLRFAFDRSIWNGHGVDGLEILISGAYLFRNTMNSGDGRRWTDRLEVEATNFVPDDRLWFSLVCADVAQGTADHRRGQLAAQSALDFARSSADDAALVIALQSDALHDVVKDPATAAQKLGEALVLADRLEDHRFAQLLRAFLAMTALADGDLDSGVAAAEAVGHEVSGTGYEVFIANWAAWTASLLSGDAKQVRYWLERQSGFLTDIGATEPWLFLWSLGILDALEGGDPSDGLLRARRRADEEGHDIAADLVIALALADRHDGKPVRAAELLGCARGHALNNLSHYVIARVSKLQLIEGLGEDVVKAAMHRGAMESPHEVLLRRDLSLD